MEVKAKLNYLRIAPRKMRLVADLIRGKKVSQALTILDFTQKKGAGPLKKLLEGAVANAKNNFQLDVDTLKISEIRVDQGPTLKRWRARARGRAAEIQKKTSHITLVVEGEKVKGGKEKEVGKLEKELEAKEKKAGFAKTKPEKEIIPPKPSQPKKPWKRIFKRKAF